MGVCYIGFMGIKSHYYLLSTNKQNLTLNPEPPYHMTVLPCAEVEAQAFRILPSVSVAQMVLSDGARGPFVGGLTQSVLEATTYCSQSKRGSCEL